MKKIKKLFLPTIALLLISTIALNASAGAQRPADLPQTPGVYDVPGNSKMKLRVFVYHAKKPGGPAPDLALSETCDLADPDSTAVDGTTGWHLPSGNITYRLNTGSTPSTIGSTKLPALVSNSFNTWKNNSDVGTQVTFTKGANTSTNRARYDGQNLISWGRTNGSALAVTYTWYYTATGVAVENDTIFNNKFRWAWYDQSVKPNCAYTDYYDAQDILTHELGHWLGLNDSYSAEFTHNTMFGYGAPTEVKKNTLSTGDKNAVNALY